MNKRPPKYPLRFFRWFCNPEYVDDIQGDLMEQFEKNPSRIRFTVEVLKLLRPSLIKPASGGEKLNYYGMLKNNFKIALRTFKREKAFTFINILGLTCGMLSAMLITLWMQDEWKYDRFHENGDNIYRIIKNFEMNNEVVTDEGVAYRVGPAFKDQFPEVLESVRYTFPDNVVTGIDGKISEQLLAAADPNFFQVFSYPMVEGSAKDCLTEAGQIVISLQVAKNYFPNKSAIGEIIEVREGSDSVAFVISGVFEIPTHSTFQTDFIITMDAYTQLISGYDNWGNTFFDNALVLRENVDISHLQVKMTKLAEDNDAWYSILLQPYQDQYLYSSFKNGKVDGGRIDSVKLFGFAALCAILIACFNYINLTTARSSKRTKEIGIRKIVGARKITLISQFLTESSLLVALSCILAIVLCQLALPLFNSLTLKSIFIDFKSLDTYLFVFGLGTSIVIFSGMYPAFLLSSFNPYKALKKVIPKDGFQYFLRKGLVVLQFSITLIIASASIVVHQQFKYFTEKDLGFDIEQVLYLELDEDSYTNVETIKDQLLQHSSILSVSGSSHDFVGPSIGFTGDVQWRLKDDQNGNFFGIHDVDANLLDMLNMKLATGRGFNPELSSDSTQYIINETAALALGFDQPIGEKLSFWGDHGEIIGVVKDFHFTTFHNSIMPVILRNKPTDSFLFFKSEPNKLKEAVDYVASTHEKFSNFPPKIHFMNQRLEENYHAELTIQKLTGYCSILALIVSSLGLLGLATYSCELRTKEIGIRKVLGGDRLHLVMMLSKEFTSLVLIAIIIGLPIAFYLLDGWLDNYSYRIDMKWWPYVLTGVSSLVISWITVGSQTLKVTSINPSETLRDE